MKEVKTIRREGRNVFMTGVSTDLFIVISNPAME